MWTWDGDEWVDVTATGPSPRMLAAMVYDPDRQSLVLFGGYDDSFALGDTWEYRDGQWTLLTATGPPPRYYAYAAYDQEHREVVLFGGFNFQTQEVLGDTWTWDGKAWTQRAVSGPSERLDGAFAYSEALGGSVLFGGRRGIQDYDDTWLWDGASWQELQFPPSGHPPERAGSRMTYIPARQALLLYGGEDSGRYGDLWELLPPLASEAGDLNCDCAVDSFDIEPFILALVDPAGYGKAHPACSRDLADVNGDGSVDVFDIEPFVDVVVP